MKTSNITTSPTSSLVAVKNQKDTKKFDIQFTEVALMKIIKIKIFKIYIEIPVPLKCVG